MDNLLTRDFHRSSSYYLNLAWVLIPIVENINDTNLRKQGHANRADNDTL